MRIVLALIFVGRYLVKFCKGSWHSQKYILAIVSCFILPVFKYIAYDTNINNLVTICEYKITLPSVDLRKFRSAKLEHTRYAIRHFAGYVIPLANIYTTVHFQNIVISASFNVSVSTQI